MLQPGLQDRRRQRPAAARPEGPARDAAARGRQRRAVHHRVRQRQRGQRRRHPARPAADRASRAATSSSASRCSTSPTSCRPIDGKGVINILAADKLMNAPRLYATFLLWMLSRAVRAAARGRRPRQAQAGVLLRRGAPAVQRRAEGAGRAHRAGRAAGAQQGRRRLLRDAEPARHPRHRARRSSATACSTRCAPSRRATRRRSRRRPSTMRANPGLDIETAITELAVGEALVSFLDDKGRPSVTERVFVHPAGQPDRADHARAAQGADRRLAGGRRLREDGRPRVGLREAQGPRRGERRCGRRGRRGRSAPHGRQRRRPAAGAGRRRRPARRPEGRALRHAPARAAASTRGWPNRRRARRCAAIGSAVGREIIRGVLGGILGGGAAALTAGLARPRSRHRRRP